MLYRLLKLHNAHLGRLHSCGFLGLQLVDVCHDLEHHHQVKNGPNWVRYQWKGIISNQLQCRQKSGHTSQKLKEESNERQLSSLARLPVEHNLWDSRNCSHCRWRSTKSGQQEVVFMSFHQNSHTRCDPQPEECKSQLEIVSTINPDQNQHHSCLYSNDSLLTPVSDGKTLQHIVVREAAGSNRIECRGRFWETFCTGIGDDQQDLRYLHNTCASNHNISKPWCCHISQGHGCEGSPLHQTVTAPLTWDT